jgi:hypothetical protein
MKTSSRERGRGSVPAIARSQRCGKSAAREKQKMLKLSKGSHDVFENKGSASQNELKTKPERTP